MAHVIGMFPELPVRFFCTMIHVQQNLPKLECLEMELCVLWKVYLATDII